MAAVDPDRSVDVLGISHSTKQASRNSRGAPLKRRTLGSPRLRNHLVRAAEKSCGIVARVPWRSYEIVPMCALLAPTVAPLIAGEFDVFRNIRELTRNDSVIQHSVCNGRDVVGAMRHVLQCLAWQLK